MVCDFKECKQTFWAKFENLNVDFVENFLMELTTTKNLWNVNVVLNVLNEIENNKKAIEVSIHLKKCKQTLFSENKGEIRFSLFRPMTFRKND